MRLSIRARLTFWYTAVLCVVLFAFGTGVLWVQQRFSRSQFDSELEAISSSTRSVMRVELEQSHDFRRAAGATRKSVNVPARSIAVLDASGATLAAHWRGLSPELLPPLKDAAEFMTIRNGPNTWRVHVTKSHSGGVPYYIVSAGPTDQLTRERRLLARTLLVATPFALFLSAGVCWWAASRALQPVTAMAAEAGSITAQAAEARLTEGSAGDELQQLARAFNRLLDRLANALQTQRQFMADASHELRTPISVAKTAADVTLSRPNRPETEYRDALSIVGEQTTRLGRIVEDMLVLARADAGAIPMRRERVALEEIAADTVHGMRLLADIRRVRLVAQIEPGASCIGDEQLLRRLLMNLLDNALKYTPAGGDVVVSVRTVVSGPLLTVSDTGCGIPARDRERVFERFVRLDPARDAASGAGLGLPIARWIAEVHGGALTLVDNERGGCTFVARLSGAPVAGMRHPAALDADITHGSTAQTRSASAPACD